MVLHYDDDSQPSGPADVLSFGGLDVRGEVSIQLYDERGKLKYEEKGDNYILPLAKQTLFKTMVYQMFAGSLKDNSAGSPFSQGVNEMQLTNYTGPKEPSYETYRRGGVSVGWADLANTYSGDDDRRGSINVKESHARADSIRIVVDFPSHAANDEEIGSVYLLDNRSAKERRWLATDVSTEILKVGSSYQRFWRLQDKRIVQKGPGNVLNELDPSTLAVSRELDNIDYSFTDAEFANGKFYYVYSGSSYIREHAGAGSETVSKSIDGFSYHSAITYVNGKFVLWSRKTSGVWGALEVDRNFNVIRFVPGEDLGYRGSQIDILEPSIYEDDLLSSWNGFLDKGLTEYVSDFSSQGSYRTFLGFIPGGKLYAYRDGYLELTPRPFGIVTRYELDNPFAKRPGETMKVIYDIIVEGEPFNPMKDPARFIK